MTDVEIIKALECCSYTKGVCKDCPLHCIKSAECVIRLTKNTLDLIRRQQEKINHFVEANKMAAETDKTEDEILKKLLTQRVEFIPNSQDVEDIKRGAVREFADRLKRMMFITDYDIDDLVNEMFPKQKGEENG